MKDPTVDTVCAHPGCTETVMFKGYNRRTAEPLFSRYCEKHQVRTCPTCGNPAVGESKYCAVHRAESRQRRAELFRQSAEIRASEQALWAEVHAAAHAKASVVEGAEGAVTVVISPANSKYGLWVLGNVEGASKRPEGGIGIRTPEAYGREYARLVGASNVGVRTSVILG